MKPSPLAIVSHRAVLAIHAVAFVTVVAAVILVVIENDRLGMLAVADLCHRVAADTHLRAIAVVRHADHIGRVHQNLDHGVTRKRAGIAVGSYVQADITGALGVQGDASARHRHHVTDVLHDVSSLTDTVH